MAGLLRVMEGPVVDPFAGSATVGIACLAAGIEYVGVKVDPTYFEIASNRLQNAFNALPSAAAASAF